MIKFETCNRQSALEFLKILFPQYEIEDTVDSASKVLDWVEKDVIRIPDPMMHGKRVAICPSTNFVESQREALMVDINSFQASPGKKKTTPEVTK